MFSAILSNVLLNSLECVDLIMVNTVDRVYVYLLLTLKHYYYDCMSRILEYKH